jgi:ferredoxin-NADP reductase
MVATRLRDSAFKRVLAQLPLGTEVQIEGPNGSLTLHNNTARTAVFIVGGIGVTPVRSMLVRAAHEHLPHKLLMLYLNRRPQDTAFLDELTGLQKQNANFRFVPIMTAAEAAENWSGEKDRLTPELLNKYISETTSPIYYLVGPPGMVNAVHELLNQTGVDDDDIRLEDFGGY